jgi:dihydrofolate reductase
MGELTVICNVTLDGVLQAPGRADEDQRGGFTHGGWATPYAGDAMNRLMAEPAVGPAAMLLGRRTYEDFAAFWPQQAPNPFTDALNRMPKYVVSATLSGPLPWQNSTVVRAADVGDLKEKHDLTLMGSGALVRSLLPEGVIDRFHLLIHPLVLGSGRRLFGPDGIEAYLTLDRVEGTSTGVVLASYRAGGPARTAAVRGR